MAGTKRMAAGSSSGSDTALTSDDMLQRLEVFVERGQKLGFSHTEISSLFNGSRKHPEPFSGSKSKSSLLLSFLRRNLTCSILCAILVMLCAFLFLYHLPTEWSKAHVKCPVRDFVMETSPVAHPKMRCDVCRNLTKVPEVTKITWEEFDRLYGFSLLPVKVKGVSTHWKAADTINLKFFKKLYGRHPEILDKVDNECFFGSYTGTSSILHANTLRQVLALPDHVLDRLETEPGWYVGWQNCIFVNDAVWMSTFYETTPDFLPPQAFSSPPRTWIFIGTEGRGTTIHIDAVSAKTWQAQLRGTKTWTLTPVSECDVECPTLNVTMEPGDTLLIDTNMWYHETEIHPGDMSVALGHEYTDHAQMTAMSDKDRKIKRRSYS